jgi:hypothetical protein
MPLLYKNQYAALMGVSHTAINKAVGKGEILLVDGKIDSDAPNEWATRRAGRMEQPAVVSVRCRK